MQDLHKIYLKNIAQYPALLGMLAADLGVSTLSLKELEIGFNPDGPSWVFPERDDQGKIVGLMQRYQDGSKYFIKGGKRGLTYRINYEKQDTEKKKWQRVSKENPCPLCGKADGCLYPDGEYDHPAAVICVHISTGADREMELGFLHVIDPERNNLRVRSKSILPSSNLPILVVEGASDVAAGMDLGFTVVGRPSAESVAFLGGLVAGCSVCILGENDAGAGKSGMEKTFVALRDACKSISKLLPPEGVKDLRVWVQGGLTQDALLQAIQSGETTLDPNIIESDAAVAITGEWIKREMTEDGKLHLRIHNNNFVKFNGVCYEEKSEDEIRGSIYRFLEGKSVLDEQQKIHRYKPSKGRLGDCLDSLSKWCLVDGDDPLWLTEQGRRSDVQKLILFKNGILDITAYQEDRVLLHPHTPDLFSYNALPYAFDPTAESSIWEEFLNDIFNEDKEKIRLLAQWFGYLLVPDMSYEKLMFLIGRPRSGKSCVLETIQAMLGDRQCCETSFQALAGSFGYQSLVGKLAAIIGDAKSPRPNEASAVLEKILHITGGDAVSINRKFKPALPMVRLKCRFTVAMNDLPAFTDYSRALEYRMNILTFENSYYGREDRGLKARLIKEASEGRLINFALRGLKDLYSGNQFVEPPSSLLAVQQFRELASPVPTFIEECIETRLAPMPTLGDWYIPQDYLYDVWCWWCKKNGRDPHMKNYFVRWFLQSCTQTVMIRMDINGKPQPIFTNIRLRDWVNKEFVGS